MELALDGAIVDDPHRIVEGVHNLRIHLLFRVREAERVGFLTLSLAVLYGGKAAKKPSQFTGGAIIVSRQPARRSENSIRPAQSVPDCTGLLLPARYFCGNALAYSPTLNF